MRRFRSVDITKEERNLRIDEIEEKWKLKASLTEDDKFFICDNLQFDKLLLYPYCFDEFFVRVFFKLFPKINERQQIYYHYIVREWESVVNAEEHLDQILTINAKETREELDKFRSGFKISDVMYSSEDYERDKFRLLEWSKYRYIISKRLIEHEFQNGQYMLSLNGKKIILDHISIAHIFARHYGQTMKSYVTDKSHFSQHFYHEEIHLQLQNIFKRIDASGLYTRNSVFEIVFRYNGTLYKIVSKRTRQQLGESNETAEFIRLITVYPLENDQMVSRLTKDYSESFIDAELSIFVRRK